MTTKIIAIANQKGGVGKTTTATSLAHGLALAEKSILLIDLDPQGQCATALGIRQEPGAFNLLVAGLEPKQVTRYAREQLWLIPGNKETSTAQIVLNAQRKPISHIRSVLAPLTRNGLDYIIFDTAPSVGGLQEMALWASDLVVVPSATDFLASQGVGKIVKTLQVLTNEQKWRGRLLGILPTFFDDVTRESQDTLADLTKAFTHFVLPPVHRATVLRECAARGQTIFEIKGQHRAATEYSALFHKVLELT